MFFIKAPNLDIIVNFELVTRIELDENKIYIEAGEVLVDTFIYRNEEDALVSFRQLANELCE